jgi:hypothetical protein
MQESLEHTQRELFVELENTMSSPALYQLLVTLDPLGQKHTEVMDLLIQRMYSDKKRLNADNPYKRQAIEYMKYYRKVARSFFGSLFNYSCQTCGFKNETRMLNFHHRDPSKKEFVIKIDMKDKKRLFTELLKCDYLCENCHYEVHAKMGDLDEEFKAIVGRRHTHVQNLLGCTD